MPAIDKPLLRRDQLSRSIGGLALAAALVGGCGQATLQEATAPELSCKASEIGVEHVEGGKGPDSPLSWEATCGERRFLCSRIHQRAICDEIPPGVQLQRG